MSFQFDKAEDTVLFEMTGHDESSNNLLRRLEYLASEESLRYTIIKGDIISSYEEKLSDAMGELCWHVVTLYPLINNVARYKLVKSVAQGGVFPDEALYPSDDLYPNLGEWDKLKREETV